MSTAPKPFISNPRPIEPGASIGHIHLKVSDLNRAIAFYGGVLGFDVMQRYGDEPLSSLRAAITITSV